MADLGHQRRIGIAQGKGIEAGGCPFREQADGGERKCVRSRLSTADRWQCQGLQPVHPLAHRAQWLPAGGQDLNAWCCTDKHLGQAGDSIDQMFAGIQYQQHRLVAEISSQVARRIRRQALQPEVRRNGAGDAMGVAQTGQVDEPDAVLNAADERSGECQRDRGFANATRADDGQEAPLGHQRGKFIDQLVAPEDPRRRPGKQRGMRTRTADLAGG